MADLASQADEGPASDGLASEDDDADPMGAGPWRDVAWPCYGMITIT